MEITSILHKLCGFIYGTSKKLRFVFHRIKCTASLSYCEFAWKMIQISAESKHQRDLINWLNSCLKIKHLKVCVWSGTAWSGMPPNSPIPNEKHRSKHRPKHILLKSIARTDIFGKCCAKFPAVESQANSKESSELRSRGQTNSAIWIQFEFTSGELVKWCCLNGIWFEILRQSRI